ncbi:MAG: hypothetical protein P1V97_02005 [Planctomycetota bacterium]|nr:hypothetical protein [Planctomycetota bacterium]
MKRSTLSLLFCSLVLALAPQSAADDSRTVKASDFFPLIPDMEWHYDITHVRGKMEKKMPFRVKVETDDHKFQGRLARSFKTRLASGRKRKEVLQREYYCYAKNGDLQCYMRENGPVEVPLDPPQTILKGTMTKGSKWSWEGTFKGRKAKSSWEVKGFAKLSLEKVIYDCIVISQTTKANASKSVQTRTLWFAKGIGLVKEYAADTSPVGKVELTGVLKSYSRPAGK